MLGLCAPSHAQADCAPDRIDAQVRVRQVIDGDTVVLSDGRHLRLIGVNAPELGYNGAPSQPYAIEARDQLRLRLDQHHNMLNLRYDVEHHDHYGRLLAHAFIADGGSVETWLQTQGLGTVLVVPPNEWNSACYIAAEQSARQARRGIWALPDYQVTESTQLAPNTDAYRLISGRVRHIGVGRNVVWLDLEGGVALRIARDDLPYFRAWRPQDLAGKHVLAHGWVHREQGELRMSIRHPSALQLLN